MAEPTAGERIAFLRCHWVLAYIGTMALRRSKKRAAEQQAAYQAQLDRLRAQLAETRAQLERERFRQTQQAEQATFLMGDVEGTWEVPVRFSVTPGGWPAITTVSRCEQLPALAPLTVFALASAYPDQARLEDLEQAGWAIAQAWPLNASDLLSHVPSFHTRRYMIVTLTSRSLRQQAVQASEAVADIPISALTQLSPTEIDQPEPQPTDDTDLLAEQQPPFAPGEQAPDEDQQRLRGARPRGVRDTDGQPPAQPGGSNFEILA